MSLAKMDVLKGVFPPAHSDSIEEKGEGCVGAAGQNDLMFRDASGKMTEVLRFRTTPQANLQRRDRIGLIAATELLLKSSQVKKMGVRRHPDFLMIGRSQNPYGQVEQRRVRKSFRIEEMSAQSLQFEHLGKRSFHPYHGFPAKKIDAYGLPTPTHTCLYELKQGVTGLAQRQFATQ